MNVVGLWRLHGTNTIISLIVNVCIMLPLNVVYIQLLLQKTSLLFLFSTSGSQEQKFHTESTECPYPAISSSSSEMLLRHYLSFLRSVPGPRRGLLPPGRAQMSPKGDTVTIDPPDSDDYKAKNRAVRYRFSATLILLCFSCSEGCSSDLASQ